MHCGSYAFYQLYSNISVFTVNGSRCAMQDRKHHVCNASLPQICKKQKCYELCTITLFINHFVSHFVSLKLVTIDDHRHCNFLPWTYLFYITLYKKFWMSAGQSAWVINVVFETRIALMYHFTDVLLSLMQLC